jgi:hypothetical protein
MKKIILTSIALATIAASPAFAATHKRVMHHDNAMTQESYASAAYATQDPYAVVVEGQLVGRDPDAGIRAYLLRDNGLNAD